MAHNVGESGNTFLPVADDSGDFDDDDGDDDGVLWSLIPVDDLGYPSRIFFFVWVYLGPVQLVMFRLWLERRIVAFH